MNRTKIKLRDKIIQAINNLPPVAQREVLEFIEFLRIRYPSPSQPENTPRKRDLSSEPFVGMWQDRDDMQDNKAWVHKVRTQEWE